MNKNIRGPGNFGKGGSFLKEKKSDPKEEENGREAEEKS